MKIPDGVILFAAIGVSIFIANKIVDKVLQPATTGVRSVDTKGRELIFQLNKNGNLTDQYGGLWT